MCAEEYRRPDTLPDAAASFKLTLSGGRVCGRELKAANFYTFLASFGSRVGEVRSEISVTDPLLITGVW